MHRNGEHREPTPPKSLNLVSQVNYGQKKSAPWQAKMRNQRQRLKSLELVVHLSRQTEYIDFVFACYAGFAICWLVV